MYSKVLTKGNMDYMSDALCIIYNEHNVALFLHFYDIEQVTNTLVVWCWIAFRKINCLLKSFQLSNKMYHELKCVMGQNRTMYNIWKNVNVSNNYGMWSKQFVILFIIKILAYTNPSKDDKKNLSSIQYIWSNVH